MTEYYPFNNEVALSVDIYRPYETVHALTSISEAKTLAQKELSERLHEFNEKGVQILENNVRIIMYGDYLEASGSLVIVCPAGVQKDLPMNHTQNSKNGETYEYNGNDD